MIDKAEFSSIGKDLDNFEKKREILIQNSRDMIKLSKRIIYALHREEVNEAKKLIKEIEKIYKILGDKCYDTSIYSTAVQEYVEALCYFNFLDKKKLPSRKELNVDTESYLLGICDLTGELMRKAVDDAINERFEHLKEIRDFVTEIYGEFLKFNLRNGELRKKYDAIKWNLNKIEDVMYDIKIRKKC